MKNWSIFKKLVLANILYSLPVIALIYLMVSAQNVGINAGSLEIKGDIVQRPLEGLLKTLLESRMKQGSVSSNTYQKEITSVKETLKTYGDELQFTLEELKKRKRESSEITSFDKRLQEFISSESSLDSKNHIDKVNSLIADARTMITHVGDTSGLILDPDLDSYYLMDVTLVALPQTQDRLSEIYNFLTSKFNNMSAEDRIQSAVYASLLKLSDQDRITADIQTTINEDPNFYGESPTLKSKLVPAIADYQKKNEEVVAVLNAISNGTNKKTLSEVQELIKTTFDASFSSWNIAVDDLDTLLNKRVDTLNTHKFKSLALSMLALAIAVAILFWISANFNANMKKVIDSLKVSVTKTRSSGSELVELSNQLSSVSNDQASAVQQTSAAMHEIQSMIKATLQNASTTHDTAEKSEMSAQSTRDAVEKLNISMQEISSANQQVLNQMEQNQKEMSEITKIISEIGAKTKVINDIVFQTKLLSFNASVEAARAGESGKGFAVVAEEVGNLAAMSGSASKEITDMLDTGVERVGTIANTTTAKVGTLVESAKEKVNLGAQLAQECDKSITEIITRISDVLDNANSIQRAAQEQAKGIDEVEIAVNRLDQIAQKNMEMSKKTNTQSKTIAEQASALEGIVDMIQTAVLGANNQPNNEYKRDNNSKPINN